MAKTTTNRTITMVVELENETEIEAVKAGLRQLRKMRRIMFGDNDNLALIAERLLQDMRHPRRLFHNGDQK